MMMTMKMQYTYNYVKNKTKFEKEMIEMMKMMKPQFLYAWLTWVDKIKLIQSNTTAFGVGEITLIKDSDKTANCQPSQCTCTDGSGSVTKDLRVGLHCQARCDYHPWRHCSLFGLSLQLDNGGGSSHPCPPLDCLKRWQSDHHPHRFLELATKGEKWNGRPGLECVDGRHPPSKTPVGELPWTCGSEGKWGSR